MVQFEIRRANGAQPYYWLIRAVGNHKILATSETYYNKQDAIDAAFLVQKHAGAAKILDYAAAA